MDFNLVLQALDVLNLGETSRLVLLEARTLTEAHVPPFPSEFPALLTGVDSPELAARVREVLLTVYPREHDITAVEGSRLKVEGLGRFQLSTFNFQPSTCFYIPALTEGTAFESFHEIVAHLRAPNGCPWDREQTHLSLRTNLLEESYEALEAIDAGDFDSMREEFGDLLLQIVLHAQIASEEGRFTMTDVVQGIHDKIVRRHPHVFGDLELKDVDGVLQNWEKLKEKERRERREQRAESGEGRAENSEGKAGSREKGLLDSVPAILPALTQAQEYQDRAARVGFDWPEIEGVLDKVREEIEEIKAAQNLEEVTGELGDLFFVLVNLARWRKVDAESALRETNLKFKKRFGYVEQGAKKQGRSLSDMSLEEMDALWNEAKGWGM
ncbi:MAG: nucleoside triphosphate pyrophosphohydrolase [Anaerolineae bacterium UTCFX3]|jgi:tetrapyrrole methylase family protein/MazG family protein|nr:MAG: nucleoside triphosphate pyrophosphohydrolase [Anaerolineae bacterium UTCFX3]